MRAFVPGRRVPFDMAQKLVVSILSLSEELKQSPPESRIRYSGSAAPNAVKSKSLDDK